ncbi:hypothetical protein EBU71_14315 [bacterium]|nr:hypothetical protein [Candidatus Elulimicrobium humile]
MVKHSLVGKLCQYQRIHLDKRLFTYQLNEQQKAELEYTLQLWHDNSNISSKTLIPSWFYHKFVKNITCPDPISYHTPYIISPSDNAIQTFNPELIIKIKTLLIIDHKAFDAKINGITVFTRNMLKVLDGENDIDNTYWVDEEWIEPYCCKETYIDDLKAKMLNKLRQNI